MVQRTSALSVKDAISGWRACIGRTENWHLGLKHCRQDYTEAPLIGQLVPRAALKSVKPTIGPRRFSARTDILVNGVV